MQKKELKAEFRKITGRKIKNLRALGILPANISGKKLKSEAVQVDLKEFKKVFSEAGETGLVELKIGTEVRPVLIHNIQKNPVSDEFVHADLLQVDLKEKVEAEVPVELTGESPAEKQGIGTVVLYFNEIKVEALPTDLPEKFIIDISELAEVDQAFYIKDIKVDKSKVDVKDDAEAIVVKVEPPQKEEEVVAPIVAVGAEGEVVAEGGPEAEGEKSEEAPKEESKK
ncbi:MAG TPA: 50S ribosomal protein L25 [Patescibacteria group bacterium]|nr:50S ribosomal protein L25 [Patescibacteria group bacterium]